MIPGIACDWHPCTCSCCVACAAAAAAVLCAGLCGADLVPVFAPSADPRISVKAKMGAATAG